MYVCMCVHMYACMNCMYVLYVCVYDLYVCMICMYIHCDLYVYMYNLYVFVYAFYVCMIRMYAYTYVCTHTHTISNLEITHLKTYIHTYTHTRSKQPRAHRLSVTKCHRKRLAPRRTLSQTQRNLRRRISPPPPRGGPAFHRPIPQRNDNTPVYSAVAPSPRVFDHII
jgi:hypothetical protein